MSDPGFVAAGFVVTTTVVAIYVTSLRSRLARARQAVDERLDQQHRQGSR